MKLRAGLLVTCAASAVAICFGLATSARAGDLNVKAAPAAVAEPVWWYEGFAEIGGRFDLNNPDKKTLGQFYNYRDLRPGVYGNFFFGAHRTGADPLDFEIWGKNVGWDDQAYGLDLASPGLYYLTAGWDETPRVYSWNAKTMYNGVGSNNLTLPNSAFLTPPPDHTDQTTIQNNSHVFDLEYRRDTAAVAGRWTPDDNWDFYADYSNTHRHGVEATGAVSFSGPGPTRSAFEVPKPIDDTTQNAALKGEYAGTTPWNTQFNLALAGGYSQYDNSNAAFTFQNPWNPVNTSTRPLNNLYSLAPDNKAGSVNVTGAVGLPLNSRYMGTFQYTHMSSDQSNLPFSINPFVLALNTGFSAPGRETDTVLSNNVLHTQITSNLQSTLKYRYYNYDPADSPAIIFAPRPPNPDSTLAFPDEEGAIRHPVNYTKQNADAQIDYRPWKWLNVGALYDWERWDRTYRNVARTNENTGKLFLDSKWGFSTFRTSIQYGERRFGEYANGEGNPLVNDNANSDSYRMMDLADRDRTKFMASWSLDVTREISITPNGGFLNDDYQTDVNFIPTANEAGIKHANSWNVGVDGTLTISPNWALFVSYNYEDGYRQVYETPTGRANVETFDRDSTVIVGSKMTLIPEKLFFDVNYTYTKATSRWTQLCTPAGCPPTGNFAYPDIHNRLNRVDAQAKYVLDDSVLRAAGFVGKAYVKARVLWEKNENDSWQSLQDQFGFLVNPTNSTTAYSIWLGTGNPNYDVVVGMLSLGLQW